MQVPRAALTVVCCFALAAAAACGGGGPTSPSQTGATTIAGMVSVGGGAATLPGAAITGWTVAVVGTNQSAPVEPSGFFQLANVPAGTVRLAFKDAFVNATVELANVGQERIIEIQVEVTGSSAVIVNEVRTNDKVTLCHRTGNGSYHSIEVSVSAESTHRAHGDAKVGEAVPGETGKTFDESCRVSGPSVRLQKTTNGDDANEAPGPTIPVGNPVAWQYIVTNTGTINLTSVVVTDDRGVAVTCPATSVPVGQSMTCSGAGVAVAGQYRNVGRVTASSTGGSVSATDPSHYFGQAPPTEDDGGPKVQICHRTGNGSFHLIDISVNAEPAHRAHGDGKIGEPVPGQSGKVFGAGCVVR
jgi:hypothetical protein